MLENEEEGGKGTMEKTLTWRARERDAFDRSEGKEFKGKTLILGNNYHSIQEYALKNNVKVKEAEISDTVAVIGMQSFYHCTGLRNINLEGVSQIRKEAFSGCIRLKEARFSDKLRMLGKYSFSQCKRLEEIKFEGVKLRKLEMGTFQECESIEKICIPKAVSYTHLAHPAIYKNIGRCYTAKRRQSHSSAPYKGKSDICQTFLLFPIGQDST